MQSLACEPCAESRCAKEGRAYEIGAGDSDQETDSSQVQTELSWLYMHECLHDMPAS